jgi:hypothetical protein
MMTDARNTPNNPDRFPFTETMTDNIKPVNRASISYILPPPVLIHTLIITVFPQQGIGHLSYYFGTLPVIMETEEMMR